MPQQRARTVLLELPSFSPPLYWRLFGARLSKSHSQLFSTSLWSPLVPTMSETEGNKEEKRHKSRYEKAWFCSRWTFAWANPLVGLSRKGKLNKNNVDLPLYETSASASASFEKEWEEEKLQKHPSLLAALRRSFWHQFIIGLSSYSLASFQMFGFFGLHFPFPL